MKQKPKIRGIYPLPYNPLEIKERMYGTNFFFHHKDMHLNLYLWEKNNEKIFYWTKNSIPDGDWVSLKHNVRSLEEAKQIIYEDYKKRHISIEKN